MKMLHHFKKCINVKFIVFFFLGLMNMPESLTAEDKKEEVIEEKSFASHPGTKLLYLENTYLFESQAKLIGRGVDTKGPFLIFDQTVFYPQGGGQPSDTGTIDFESVSFKVGFVGFQERRVVHYIDQEPKTLVDGSTAIMKIEPERRILNARSHTSGHLLDCIIQRVAPELIAKKGYHFPEGPYVEFEGNLTSLDQTDFLRTVNEALSAAVQSALHVRAFSANEELLKSLRVSSSFKIPDGKEMRIVQIGDFSPTPCGGTHVRNLSELRQVSIRKLARKGAITRLSYSFFSERE